MKILVANDDGIFADGINALVSKLLAWGKAEIVVIAPDRTKNATSHSLTLDSILRLRKTHMPNGYEGFTVVDGSPADCVLVGLNDIAPDADLVVSGINLGTNCGIDVLYSGTVGAASEAIINGKPAIAISSEGVERPFLENSADIFISLLDQGLLDTVSSNWVLNINVPALPREQIKGVTWARMSRHGWTNRVQRREDPRGQVYYWVTGERSKCDDGNDGDYERIQQGFVTMTPVGLDLTNYDAMDSLSKRYNFKI